MSKDLVDQFTKLEGAVKKLGDDVVEAKTRLAERQQQLREKLDSVKDNYGVDPNDIPNVLAKLKTNIESGLIELRDLLNDVEVKHES